MKLLIKLNEQYLFKRYEDGDIPYSTFNVFDVKTTKCIKKEKINYRTVKYESCGGDSEAIWKISNNLLNKKNRKLFTRLFLMEM